MSEIKIENFLDSVNTTESGSKKKRKRGIGIADIEKGFLTLNGSAIPETDDDYMEDEEAPAPAVSNNIQNPQPQKPAPDKKNENRQDNSGQKGEKPGNNNHGNGNNQPQSTDPVAKKLELILKGQRELMAKIDEMETSRIELNNMVKSNLGNIRQAVSSIHVEERSQAVSSAASEMLFTADEYNKLLEEKESTKAYADQVTASCEKLGLQVSEYEKQVGELSKELERLKLENVSLRKGIAGYLKKNGVTAGGQSAKQAESAPSPAPAPVMDPVPDMQPKPVQSAPRAVYTPSAMPVSGAQQIQPVISPVPQAAGPAIQPVAQGQIAPASIPPGQAYYGMAPAVGQIPMQSIPAAGPEYEPPSPWGNDNPPTVSFEDEPEKPKKKGLFHRK